MRYAIVIKKAEGNFSAYVPDLPGCTTSGDTVEQVKSTIRDAVETYLDSLREHNEPIPPPSSQANITVAMATSLPCSGQSARRCAARPSWLRRLPSVPR